MHNLLPTARRDIQRFDALESPARVLLRSETYMTTLPAEKLGKLERWGLQPMQPQQARELRQRILCHLELMLPEVPRPARAATENDTYDGSVPYAQWLQQTS
jgi:hypothetical protein